MNRTRIMFDKSSESSENEIKQKAVPTRKSHSIKLNASTIRQSFYKKELSTYQLQEWRQTKIEYFKQSKPLLKYQPKTTSFKLTEELSEFSSSNFNSSASIADSPKTPKTPHFGRNYSNSPKSQAK